MNPTRKTAHAYLAHFGALMLVYAAATLLGAIKFLGADPLALTLPYAQVAQLADAALLLALLSGVLGGGMLLLEPGGSAARLARRGWTLACVVVIGAGILGLLHGRAGLPLPPILAILVTALVTIALVIALRGTSRWSGAALAWAAGTLISVIGMVIGLLPADPARDPALSVLAAGLRDYLGIGLAAVALLIRPLDAAPSPSLDRAAYLAGGLWSLAAAFLTLQALIPLGMNAAAPLGVVGLPLFMLLIVMTVVRFRSPLSAPWALLALALLLAGAGLIGAINALPSVNLVIAGTRLTDLQRTLMLLAFAAVLFDVAGTRWRAPFWLVSAGVILAALGLGAAGIAQVYLERLISIGYLETQTLITPLYLLWVIGWATTAVGLIGCAFQFWSRRAEPES